MPTIFYFKGYRFFFFSNENNEPVHIHVEKAESLAKFWLDPIDEVYSYGYNSKQRKEIRAIIESKLETLKQGWEKHFGKNT